MSIWGKHTHAIITKRHPFPCHFFKMNHLAMVTNVRRPKETQSLLFVLCNPTRRIPTVHHEASAPSGVALERNRDNALWKSNHPRSVDDPSPNTFRTGLLLTPYVHNPLLDLGEKRERKYGDPVRTDRNRPRSSLIKNKNWEASILRMGIYSRERSYCLSLTVVIAGSNAPYLSDHPPNPPSHRGQVCWCGLAQKNCDRDGASFADPDSGDCRRVSSCPKSWVWAWRPKPEPVRPIPTFSPRTRNAIHSEGPLNGKTLPCLVNVSSRDTVEIRVAVWSWFITFNIGLAILYIMGGRFRARIPPSHMLLFVFFIVGTPLG